MSNSLWPHELQHFRLPCPCKSLTHNKYLLMIIWKGFTWEQEIKKTEPTLGRSSDFGPVSCCVSVSLSDGRKEQWQHFTRQGKARIKLGHWKCPPLKFVHYITLFRNSSSSLLFFVFCLFPSSVGSSSLCPLLYIKCLQLCFSQKKVSLIRYV